MVVTFWESIYLKIIKQGRQKMYQKFYNKQIRVFKCCHFNKNLQKMFVNNKSLQKLRTE